MFLVNLLLLVILKTNDVVSKEIKVVDELTDIRRDLEISDSDKLYQYVAPSALLTVTPVINQRILTDSAKKYNDGGGGLYYLPPATQPPRPQPSKSLQVHTIVDANPLLAALLLSSILGIEPKSAGFNHPQHLPTNPYIALLLSHYGRYVPLYGVGRGIYGYAAANNYHNNKPFGAYKIYEDRDS